MRYPYLILFFLFFPFIDVTDDLTLTLDEQTVATVNRRDFKDSFFGNLVLNNEKYLQLVETIEEQVYQEPENAFIDRHENIVAEQVGYKLAHRTFKEFFMTYFYDNRPAEIEVPRLTVYPKVDSEVLADIRTQQIGRYVTYFNSFNKERSHNISLATEAINNHVVFPGETFSFNKVVGKRTAERGYLSAPVIVKGELAEGIGGGICQVSSTLFNAVDKAGLDIVQRYAHSRRVPYVPPGRDATVSWYGPDFVFKNKLNQPILIRARTYGGQMVVLIYSSESINNEPRTVPSAPNKLPEEINIE